MISLLCAVGIAAVLALAVSSVALTFVGAPVSASPSLRATAITDGAQ
eukprot:CAMPEP_0168437768 /NCGR_PEP_ID=MMETSP0228-20121227/41613_1 /TAXON_ID=133427 /ORGANISM="Protoceratium reticulatum, Strain CCCM 535 (=CCMP 1889)" /LENGTH=46 /DNA_ID= /DNA_START= /DNA_END= /DNA_ORIENTATION=